MRRTINVLATEVGILSPEIFTHQKKKKTVVLVTLFTGPYCEKISFSGDQNEWECHIVWGMSRRHHYTRQAGHLGDKDQHKNWNDWQLEGSTFCSFIFTCYNPLFSLDLSPILYLLFQALMCFLTTCKVKLKKLVLQDKLQSTCHPCPIHRNVT